ncbi:CRISPR-associated protein Cas5 [Pseudogemmobacter hezensis]
MSLPFPSRQPRFLPLSLPFASFRRPFRFGEAVSRPRRQNPQGKK